MEVITIIPNKQIHLVRQPERSTKAFKRKFKKFDIGLHLDLPTGMSRKVIDHLKTWHCQFVFENLLLLNGCTSYWLSQTCMPNWISTIFGNV